MIKENDGGPAFPTEESENGTRSPFLKGGMTLRDYFAGQVIPTLLARALEVKSNLNSEMIGKVSKDAYQIADAMISERSK